MVVAPPRFPGSVPPTGMIRRPGAADLGQLLPSTVRVRITDAQGTRVVTLPLEDYVLGAVRAELPPKTLQEDAVDRVLLVQALVSRTYALANLGRHAAEGFDLCDSTLRLAEDVGLGTRDLKRIEVVGTPIVEAHFDFAGPRRERRARGYRMTG